MAAPRGWRRTFRFDRGARRVEHDVDQEIAFHLEMRTRRLIERGIDAEAARQQAAAAFGDLSGVRSECITIGYQWEKRMHWRERLHGVAQDMRYALRSLRQRPAFTATVVAMLAFGIGANTATFTVLDALMFRSLPVPHPGQLVIVGDPSAVHSAWTGSPEVRYVSYPVYADVRAQTQTLSDVYALGTAEVEASAGGASGDDGAAESPGAVYVTGNYFSVLQVPALLGRTFTTQEHDVPGGDPVIVISYDYWQTRLGGDARAIGRTIRINELPMTVIGVMPEWFTGDVVGERTDIWIPMAMQSLVEPRRSRLTDRHSSWLLMMGRLAPGASIARAKAEITAIELRSIRAHLSGFDLADFNNDLRTDPVRVVPGARGFSGARSVYGSALIALMTAVGLVILIVSANVANLMLVRGVGRRREMTVRLALGAARTRLVQLLLAESVTLAVLGGLAGLAISVWASRLLLELAGSGEMASSLDVTIDGRVLLFTAAATLATAVLFGLAPALRATRVNLATTLRTQGRSVAGSRTRARGVSTGQILVVAQIGVSVLLLIGTTLLVKNTARALTIDLGLDRRHLITVHAAASRRGYAGARLAALARDLVERAEHVPGVIAAAYTQQGLFSGGHSSGHVTIPGFTAQADTEREVRYDNVGPGYFTAIGARLVRGRDFAPRDARGGAPAAVINETMARRYFSAVDPIGRSVILDSVAYSIVGVVRDVQEEQVREGPIRRLYLSAMDLADHPQSIDLVVRTAGDPPGAIQPLRVALLGADRTVPMHLETLERRVRASVAQNTLVTKVTALFGLVALLLAAIGLYGVMSYTTSQRTSELGLRAALGADAGTIAAMILRDALRLAAAGLVVGLPIGLAGQRLVQGNVFGLETLDVASLSAVILVLVGTALAASYAPARRGARVGPAEALRSE